MTDQGGASSSITARSAATSGSGQLEPLTLDQVDRYVCTALFQGARLLSGRVAGSAVRKSIARIRALIGTGDGDDNEDPRLLRMIKGRGC